MPDARVWAALSFVCGFPCWTATISNYAVSMTWRAGNAYDPHQPMVTCRVIGWDDALDDPATGSAP